MRSRIGLAAFVTFCAVVCATVTVAQTREKRSVRDGVFSAAQVERGRTVFNRVCMDCHELEEFTAAGAYLEEVEGDTIWEVFEYIWSEMPEDYPASLDPEQYAAVLSYILSVWGHPTGDIELPIERAPLEAIVIERPERPGS